MTDITIPPEALEAAARAICEADFNLPHDAPDFHVYARAACLAMLAAWPGMGAWQHCARCNEGPHLLLPLAEKGRVMNLTPEQNVLREAYDVLSLILSDDESNRGSCPCGAKYVRVTRQRLAWDVMRKLDAALALPSGKAQ